MAQESINPLYAELTLLKAKLNAARTEYNDALAVKDQIVATQAWQQWKLAEQEIALMVIKCDRRRGAR